VNQETILVVEDDQDIAGLLEAELEQSGYLVRVAYDGTAGLAECLREPPDLVITDDLMPGCDGYDLCQCLRNDPGTRTVPVLMMGLPKLQRSMVQWHRCLPQ
jgi:two-component system phosphate regulon response regulator PhoB